jgi:hypothetical protein
LYAHLAHGSEDGPRESPVWFHWDGRAFWIIGGKSFPANLKREPRCALGIVDWNPATGRSQHVGVRGRAEILPFDTSMVKTIFRRYFGPEERAWDKRFDDVFTGELNLEMVRITPETVVGGAGSRPSHFREASRPRLPQTGKLFGPAPVFLVISSVKHWHHVC